ncbi:hypothetical protein ACU8MG_06115 [Rhizobium leguminosarum]
MLVKLDFLNADCNELFQTSGKGAGPMNYFHATICFCAVVVTAIAVYFFWQDQSDRRAFTMSEVERRAERVNRDLERMGLLKP